MSERSHLIATSITMGVSGVHTRFECVDTQLKLRVTFPRTRFVTADVASPDCTLRVGFGDPHPGSASARYVSGGTWEVHEGSAGGDRVVFYTALSGGGRSPMTRLDLSADLSSGDLVVEPRYVHGNVLELGYPLDEYVMARLLARNRAVIVHASSVVDDGGAYVFTGHSGAGKSTISSIAEHRGMRVLSDDRTVLSIRGGTVYACGTPWHGSQQSGWPEAVPVHAIFLLEQAGEDASTPIDEDRALAELLVRSVRPLAEVGEQVMVLDALAQIVRSTPSAVLRFTPRATALEAARDFVTV